MICYDFISFIGDDKIRSMRSAFVKGYGEFNFLLNNLLSFALLAPLFLIADFTFSFAVIAIFLHLLIHAMSDFDQLCRYALSLTVFATLHVLSSLAVASFTQTISLDVDLNQISFVDLLEGHINHHLFRFDFWFLLLMLAGMTKHHLHQLL